MTNRMNHKGCDHEATKAGRAACRQAIAASRSETARQVSEAKALLDILASGYEPKPGHWVLYGARHFAGYRGDDAFDAALAVRSYFAPSGDAETDARRKANGYTITTDNHTIAAAIFRAAS